MEKNILITGAGTGIGKAIAVNLAKNRPDATLILTGRNLEKLKDTHELIGKNHKVFGLDVTKLESIQALKQNLVKENIKLSGLVLNAGIGGENHYGEHDRWDEIIATNLTGPYLLTQELIPLMKEDQNSFKNIVMISSILGRIGVPKYAAYCSSKAGLLGLMRSLAAEHASDKILVNAICPGWVDTEMSRQGIEAISQGTGLSIKESFDLVMGPVPLKKMAQPDEIAEVVQFLVSARQTSITGQTFDINNGALMP